MSFSEGQAEGLRQRNVSMTGMSQQDARQAVLQLNALEEKIAKPEDERKTFGRTPDGTGMRLHRAVICAWCLNAGPVLYLADF